MNRVRVTIPYHAFALRHPKSKYPHTDSYFSGSVGKLLSTLSNGQRPSLFLFPTGQAVQAYPGAALLEPLEYGSHRGVEEAASLDQRTKGFGDYISDDEEARVEQTWGPVQPSHRRTGYCLSNGGDSGKRDHTDSNQSAGKHISRIVNSQIDASETDS